MWYAALVPVFAAAIWGTWVTQPQFRRTEERLASSDSSIRQSNFDQAWLNSIAQAYGDTAIAPDEFEQCYERLREVTFNVPAEERVCDIFMRRNFVPNLVSDVQNTPRNRRFELFRAHEIYPEFLFASNEIWELVNTAYPGGLSTSEKRRVAQILAKLESFDIRLDRLDIEPYVWNGFSKPLAESILDARSMLNPDEAELSDRFREKIFPQL